MALYQGILLALFIILVAISIEATNANGALLKGSVTCLDCDDGHIHDLSGIKVLVKCSKVKEMMATTSKEGSFETKLPNGILLPKSCSVKILGGQTLLFYATKSTNIASKVVKTITHGGGGRPGGGRRQDQDDYYYYTNSEPLNFYKSCPPNKYEKCSEIADTINDQFGSAKTVDLPIPREWGLAPTSYYLPFIPIIGIP